MRFLLSFLRALVVVKQHSGPFGRIFSRPLIATGHFFIRHFGVPAYRLVFFLRRQTKNVYLPAKSRVIFLIANRFTIHAVVIAIVGLTVFLNVQTSDVRAESFGEKSLLYALVSDDLSGVVEEVIAREVPVIAPSSYFDIPALSMESGVDFHSFDSDYVSTTVGADALLSPTVRDTRTSVAARSEAQKHVVQEGDTLGHIAEKFGLNLTTILWSNQLTFRSTIRPGQELVIPPVDGVNYAVRSGDTLLAIARRYRANAEEIVRFNKLDSDETLQIGQELMIPNGQPPAPAAPSRSASFSQIFSAPSASTGGERGSATGTGDWVWPTDWRVITQYFTWRHTGIDIDGDYTTNSYAAADGEVVYAGWRRGYGLTVEIDHGNGIMTRYGHHSSLYVKAGDIVSAGQAIARTGTTGRSTGTHLHFEVIVNGRFKNPLEYVR